MIGRSLGSYALAVLLLVHAACGSKKSEPDNKPEAAGSAVAEEPKDPDGPPEQVAVTPQKLAPIIRELAPDNVVAEAIVIELAMPAIDRDGVGRVSSKSELKITPEVPGTLRYTGVSELTFTPSRPLELDTKYTIELTRLETRDGPITPPAGTTWSHSFTTPPFKLLSWAPTAIDIAKRTVTMELTFSGPVLIQGKSRSMTFSVNGAPTNAVTLSRRRAPNVLVATFNGITGPSKLSVAIPKDFASMTGARAAAASADYAVGSDKLVAVKAAKLIEGSNGFYVEVVCDDAAAPAGRRSYYEGEGYYGLSERCVLTDAAVQRVKFTPAVANTYVVSGRAGFRIFGDFKRGAYTMRIEAGAASVDGGVVAAPFSRAFAVPARKPSLSFGASGRYLPRSAWSSLAVKHLNVEAVNLVVRQVPPENLVFWLSNDQTDIPDERTSNVVLRKTIPLRGESDAQTTSWLDVGSMLPTTSKGVLELRVVGIGAKATSRLMLTNMSLVAKKSAVHDKPWLQTVQAWALDMQTTKALEDVEVSLVRKSGKVVARCTTDGANGCTLTVKPDADPDHAEPFALIARKADDLTYIRYQDLRAEVAESSTSGAPYVASSPYRAAVYADRGVYRPGDTTHVSAVIRDSKDRAPAQPLPIEIKVIDPRAKLVKKLSLKTNSAGMVTFDHVLPAFADTGHWRVTFAVADKQLASHDLHVEEIVPERMKVTATAKRADLLVGEQAAIDVTAKYLFGGNALDSGVELTCSVEPSRFEPETNSDFTYGVTPKGKAVTLGTARGQLDPRGAVTVACPAPQTNTTFTQTGELTAVTAVLEAGSGRSTVRTATATVHPEKFYLGLKTKAVRASSGEEFTVEGLIVDWAGKPVSNAATDIRIELAHLEADYSYGYDEDTGESRYDRWLRAVPEGKQQAKATGGKFQFTVKPGDASAGYVVRVLAGKAKTELVLDGDSPWEYYGYGDDEHADSTPRPAKPTQLKLEAPKQIKVGAATTVSARIPYKGKVLWTVETDRVISSEWKDVTGAEATWSFTLKAFAPNVYVSAFVVKDPHLESKDAFLPDRAFGISSIRVEPVEFAQPVKLDAPKQIRSSSPLSITLDVGPTTEPTFATVAVVDEGILSLTSFRSPDPLAQLFAKRALAVETYETVGWTMLHQPAGASSRTGGGDEGEEESDGGGGALDKGRVQPVKPVALFSGLVPVGADGKVTIPFQVPSYRGQLRVMAVTASASRVGHAEAQVTVRDPVVVQVTFPRFVTHKDELQIPVFLTNMSGGPLDIAVAIDSEQLAIAGIARPKITAPPLEFGAKPTESVKLDDGRAETVVFSAKATMPIGGAKLRVVAKARGRAGSFEVKDEVEVPFLPAGPKQRAVQVIKVEPGTLDLAARASTLKGWIPTSETTTFWLTTNRFAQSFDHLKYLIHYPYGCIEQTTSTTRPLLYLANVVEQIDPELAQLKIEDMVLAGIHRVLSMETPSGGFGYWPGATEPVDWGTAYATHMLLDAKKAGYPVPDDRLADVIEWIEHRVASFEQVFDPSGKRRFSLYHDQGEAYLHYVLALAGKPKKARILKLISQIPATAKAEQLEDLYMLKAALYLAGDRRYAADLKTVDASPIAPQRINSWSFYSDQRRRGFMLSTFHDLFGNDAAGEPLAERVAQALTTQPSSYYNTQELVWGLTGLGKWVAGSAAKGTAAGKLVADGATIEPRATKRKTNDKTWTLVRASEYERLTLDLPAQAAGLWLVITSEGVREGNDYKVGGNGLDVSHRYRALDGDPVNVADGSLQLGDLVFVEVTIKNTTGTAIQNIALVDRLPAGFEIENPRLGRSVQPDWIDENQQWSLEFMNARDDRIEAFGRLEANTTRRLVYTVRAVTSGTFTIPPVEAEAMYDPTLWARERAGTAVVGGPWTAKTL
ncbi:MAG: alpha-2-macroglobulin [Kofleriaceae bacterium]